MLRDRLRTSAVLISLVVALLYLDGNYSIVGAEGLWLLPLLLFFSLGSAWDIVSMIRNSAGANDSAYPSTPPRTRVLFLTCLVTLSATVPLLWPLFDAAYPQNCPVGELGWIVVAGIMAIFLGLMAEMRCYEAAGRGALQRVLLSSFVVGYVGLPFALMVSLRSLGDGNWGLAALLTMIAVTKSADAGAYFAGKSFGKRKLIPNLSPGKTWEGLIGGIITATVVAFGCLLWLFPAIANSAAGPVLETSIPGVNQPWLGALLLGPLLAIAGLVGDLAESMIKRDSGAKDSGTWLPGLGGVWDVTDSLIAAVLPAYLCFAAGVGLG
ncbi:phosphatidate cytidylyltransferase [Rubripirellula amarantea]|nr:phosphatidate cytidylyltransferase [Rubripirellula amarantea]